MSKRGIVSDTVETRHTHSQHFHVTNLKYSVHHATYADIRRGYIRDWLTLRSNRMRIRNATMMKPAILHFSLSVTVGIQLIKKHGLDIKSMDNIIHTVPSSRNKCSIVADE